MCTHARSAIGCKRKTASLWACGNTTPSPPGGSAPSFSHGERDHTQSAPQPADCRSSCVPPRPRGSRGEATLPPQVSPITTGAAPAVFCCGYCAARGNGCSQAHQGQEKGRLHVRYGDSWKSQNPFHLSGIARRYEKNQCTVAVRLVGGEGCAPHGRFAH